MKGLDVKEIRKKLNLNQTDFGEIFNVSLRTVQNWESAEYVSRKVELLIQSKYANIALVNEPLSDYKLPDLTEEEIKIIEKFKGITMQELAWYIAYKEKDLLRVRNFNLWLRVKQQEGVIKILKER